MSNIYVARKIEVYPPKISNDIIEENFVNMARWRGNESLIRTAIISPFRDSLSERVEENSSVNYPMGEILFEIRKYLKERPSYKSVITNFKKEVEQLLNLWEGGKLREGYRTFGDELFIDLEYLKNRINTLLKESAEKGKFIETNINLISPESLKKEVPERIVVDFGHDYSVLAEYNGRIYVLSKNFISTYNEPVKKFEEKIKEEALNMLGENKKGTVNFSFPQHEFRITVIPYNKTLYSKIVNSFIKEPPKRITKRTRIGDLPKIELLIREGAEEFLKEKGLLDDSFLEDYRPRKDGERILISVSGLLERIRKYEEENKEIEYKQRIELVL